MGWAKYYEDNLSIYNGRMAMRGASPVIYERSVIEVAAVKAVAKGGKKIDYIAEKPVVAHKTKGRKGLKVVFQNGVDESMIRKMQMNGWWWSKANACWFNQDTNGNRKYAKSLEAVGARVSVVL